MGMVGVEKGLPDGPDGECGTLIGSEESMTVLSLMLSAVSENESECI